MIDEIAALERAASEQIRQASSPDALEKVRIEFLGRQGSLTKILKTLGGLEADQRKSVGAAVNKLKNLLTEKITARKIELTDSTPTTSYAIDTTRPSITGNIGGLHPTVQMMYDLDDAFRALNFEIFDGPEITTEEYEFDHMNFPADHPARESMDTYWLDSDDSSSRLCLRPHLTGASVRYMQEREPPFRLVYPGQVYRNETTDARHERAFFQYEALIVDRDCAFNSGQLLVNTILDTVFGRPVRTRMRAGFFPFVEPGFEIDMECLVCGGDGCSLCKHVGWLEVMPGGVPHPNVLKAAGVDPDEWMGFYINVGLDRLVMMRYGIDDVRLFHGNDLRFLSQFK